MSEDLDLNRACRLLDFDVDGTVDDLRKAYFEAISRHRYGILPEEELSARSKAIEEELRWALNFLEEFLRRGAMKPVSVWDYPFVQDQEASATTADISVEEACRVLNFDLVRSMALLDKAYDRVQFLEQCRENGGQGRLFSIATINAAYSILTSFIESNQPEKAGPEGSCLESPPENSNDSSKGNAINSMAGSEDSHTDNFDQVEIFARPDSKGCVYALRNWKIGKRVLKLGFTTKSPEERAKSISRNTGVYGKWEPVYAAYVNCHPYRIEQRLFEQLANFRDSSQKEFFNLDLIDVVLAIRAIGGESIVNERWPDRRERPPENLERLACVQERIAEEREQSCRSQVEKTRRIEAERDRIREEESEQNGLQGGLLLLSMPSFLIAVFVTPKNEGLLGFLGTWVGVFVALFILVCLVPVFVKWMDFAQGKVAAFRSKFFNKKAQSLSPRKRCPLPPMAGDSPDELPAIESLETAEEYDPNNPTVGDHLVRFLFLVVMVCGCIVLGLAIAGVR